MTTPPDPWRDDDDQPEIDPVVLGQWIAALIFNAVCLGLVAWAAYALFTFIKGAT